MRTDTFLKIAEHDHTGSGSGTQITTGGLATDSVTGAKILLANAEYLKGRNNANSANISIIKVGTADTLEFGAVILAASVTTLSTSLINTLATAVTLADNQSAITTGIITLSTDESCTVHYRLVRNGVTQNGTLRFTDADTFPADNFQGTDVGVTFTVSSGALFYATTSTGNTASMTYTIIKE